MHQGAWIYVTAAVLLLAARGDVAQADRRDNDDIDRSLRACVPLHAIRRADVVDDDTILFYMRNHDIYQNDLPRRCPNLHRSNLFMYKVQNGRLCSIDVITVIQGPHMLRGFSCPLGKFAPISDEAAAEVKGVARILAAR